jgi:pilus assembly protein CpaE
MVTTLKVIALLLNKDTAKEVEAGLCRVEGVNISTRLVDEGQALGEVGHEELPDVIVIEIDGHKERDIDDIEHILNEYGDRITIFVTTKGDDMDTMRQLMRAGVKDVFPQPLQAHELVMAVTKALAEKRSRVLGAKGQRGGVTAFVNAKGGSGATTLAVNVAYFLKANSDASVALIDLDIQFGTAAMFLDLKPTSNVVDALQQPERIDPVFLRALMTKHESGLEVLASPGDLSSVEDVSGDAVTDLLQAAVEIYDFVIIDMPRIFVPWTVAAMKFADPVIVVVQNDVPTLRDAKLLLEQLPLMGVAVENIEVVNNRAMSKMHNISIKSLKEALRMKKVHRVRNDYETAVKAQDSGVPVVEVAKHSDMTKDIKGLAENLATSHLTENDESKGLLGKLFGRGN